MAHWVASDEKFSLAIILILRRWSASSLTIERATSADTPATHLEIGQISQKSRRDGRNVSGLKVAFDQGIGHG